MSELSLDELSDLLEESETKVREKKRSGEWTAIMVAPSRHVSWLERKDICKPGRCGSAGYIKVDGQPYCLMHAFQEVCKLLGQYED